MAEKDRFIEEGFEAIGEFNEKQTSILSDDRLSIEAKLEDQDAAHQEVTERLSTLHEKYLRDQELEIKQLQKEVWGLGDEPHLSPNVQTQIKADLRSAIDLVRRSVKPDNDDELVQL